MVATTIFQAFQLALPEQGAVGQPPDTTHVSGTQVQLAEPPTYAVIFRLEKWEPFATTLLQVRQNMLKTHYLASQEATRRFGVEADVQDGVAVWLPNPINLALLGPQSRHPLESNALTSITSRISLLERMSAGPDIVLVAMIH
ncbi:hypothetical protein EDB81DRAFT_759986 [Dactylonectria macrodidyma]|uniref:Uncharacterized protein n=1 Tax=Dactylonectria macrodidyma TaxID=307937 RepID=A0A9P9ETA4_9HYPO|nr:hypothetical protein EDB81DRAFT_759986 [Dactylonectria macrodidyma]